MLRNCIILLFILISITAYCQNDSSFKFENVIAKDFNATISINDSDAAAVILYEAGETHFIGNSHHWFSYVFTCTKKIRIISKRAFDLATIEIGLYSNGNRKEELSNVRGITYNISDDIITKDSINNSNIFFNLEDANHTDAKFTLPDIHEGSVIEYTYTITSPFDFNLPDWEFQTAKYPVVYSTYKVAIPSTLTYAVVHQGLDSFFISKSWESRETYNNPDQTVTANTINHVWVEKNIKPLSIQNYIFSPKNYIDKIEFQLASEYNGEDHTDVVRNWQDVCKYFTDQKDFEQTTENDNSWIKELDVFKTGESDLNIAKDIYYYIQKNYTCTDNSDIFYNVDLYDVYKKHAGTIRGINLLLLAMLHKKQIYAQPIILSTRDNGFVNPYYPVLEKLNYLICRVYVSGRIYLLDATDPTLGFGELPVNCYNGYARIVDVNHPDSLYLSADSLKDTEITTLSLNSDDAGKFSGTYKFIMGAEQSLDMRRKMLTTTQTDYFNELKKSFSFDINLTNTYIDSLDEKELPVSIKYDESFIMNDDIIYFNPISIENIQKQNPFAAAQRSLPVEMPYCINHTYILNMQVPSGYSVDELPKSARISLNGDDGSFEYLIKQTNDNIQLLCRTKINKATFDPDDYETLRKFFAYIVEKESEQIVFKKS